MPGKHGAALTGERRQLPGRLVNSGRESARKVTRARVPLGADDGESGEGAVAAPGAGRATVERARKRFAQDGPEAALTRKPPPPRERVPGGAAERVVPVTDNLNTHTPAGPYQAFGPEGARRITRKSEAHYTPGHGSWLNGAEVEPSVPGRRMPGRVPDAASPAAPAAAVARERNDAGRGCDRRLTTADARIRPKRLYPSIEVR